jgi:ribonuclease HI
VVTFKNDNILVTDMENYKLDGRCSNNQAEQLAILEALESIHNMDTKDRTVQMYTDSRITLESLKNRKNHKHLIEKIRSKVTELEKQNWKIEFNWIKAHARHRGNELADQLGKRQQLTVISTSANKGSQKVQ